MAAAAASESSDHHGARTDLNLLDSLLARCTFPPSGDAVTVAFSGGPDSTALVALALHHGLHVTAHHVDHGIRSAAAAEADVAHDIAERLGARFVVHRLTVAAGPNLEARARDARRAALPAEAMTGHTADDQAETVLLRLLRGSGTTGLAAMRPGHRHPILGLRREETRAVCDELGVVPVADPTNVDTSNRRSRIRHELLPLADAIAGRDVAPILARTADVLRLDDELLDSLAAPLDPTDAGALVDAHPALARRALRRWLTEAGYPPDAASIERVLAVARGEATACELPGGRRVARRSRRLRVDAPAPAPVRPGNDIADDIADDGR